MLYLLVLNCLIDLKSLINVFVDCCYEEVADVHEVVDVHEVADVQ